MRLISALAVLAIATPAAANPYEAFIDVESEEDLQDLLATQQITEETYDTLIDLFTRGVDLNRAGRDELYSLPNLTYDDVDAILAFRKEQGFIRDPADLVGTGALTDDKLLAIAAFLIVRDPFAGRHAVHGFVQTQTRFTIGDDLVPPLAVRARFLYGRHLTAGLAASMTRLRAGDVVYDPNRDALLVERPGVQAHLPKFYVAYDTDEFAAIAGTYRIGFGQRLTFDNSSDYTPNGIYRDDQVFHSDGLSRECNETTGELGAGNSPCADDFHYVSPDFKWREALMGVAAGAKHIPIGEGFLQLYGFGSFSPRSIYQYELVDRSQCEDPRDDNDPLCAAPDVIIRPDGDPLAPSSALSYATLPNMYGEAVVGGNATLFLTRRNYLGVTAYGATDSWFVDDGGEGTGDRLALDFQEWSSRPSGGSFGAIGLNTSVSHGNYDLGAELTHSFDGMAGSDGPVDGGGGPAAVVRGTYTTPKKQELELSVRYFSVDFVNPFGRPIAAGDEFEGQRARNEVGTRARYTARHGKIGVRAGADLWRTLEDDQRTPSVPEDVPKGELYVRADVNASKQLRWGVWLDVQDKDLTEGGRGQCYDQTFEFDELDEPVDCKGMQLSTTGRVRFQVDRQLALQGQVTHQLVDSANYDGDPHPKGFRQDLSAYASASYKLDKRTSLRGRIRYLSEDVADGDVLEESLWTYADATVKLRKKDRLRVRIDYYQYLDDRERTQDRTPSPEVWLYAMYEAKF